MSILTRLTKNKPLFLAVVIAAVYVMMQLSSMTGYTVRTPESKFITAYSAVMIVLLLIIIFFVYRKHD